jgi:hypothetical protein
MNNSIHLIILSVAVLVGGYYFYKEINKIKDKFSNLERLHHNIEEKKEKPTSHHNFYSNNNPDQETNNASLETEFANFTYEENENSDSENNLENIADEQQTIQQNHDESSSEVSIIGDIINGEDTNYNTPYTSEEPVIDNEKLQYQLSNFTENGVNIESVDVNEEKQMVDETEENQTVDVVEENQTVDVVEENQHSCEDNTGFNETDVVFNETTIESEQHIHEDNKDVLLVPDDSDENSSEEKMEIIESYLNNQSGNISISNKDDLLKHYNSFKLNEIKSEFIKLGLKVPKGKKKELIDELINNVSSSSISQ